MAKGIKSYRDLEVWRKSMSMVRQIYQTTTTFPGEEKFGLVNQMRRAAVSIPSNLAEGHSRWGQGEFPHSISIAMGSLAELETQILLSVDLGYMNNDHASDLLQELNTMGKMLQGLRKSLKNRRPQGTH